LTGTGAAAVGSGTVVCRVVVVGVAVRAAAAVAAIVGATAAAVGDRCAGGAGGVATVV
jgi:hypothetical protein